MESIETVCSHWKRVTDDGPFSLVRTLCVLLHTQRAARALFLVSYSNVAFALEVEVEVEVVD